MPHGHVMPMGFVHEIFDLVFVISFDFEMMSL